MAIKQNSDILDLFQNLKNGVLAIDPIAFIEKYLTLDGEPFRLNNNGYKPFVDIYRYIGSTALEDSSKAVVFVKGRQIGASTMAAALELYFMCCGLFGTVGRPSMRVAHCFPQLEIAYKYSKTKLNTMIESAVQIDDPRRPGKKMSYIKSMLDNSGPSNDSLQFKQFGGGNQIFVESLGLTGDRIRGMSLDCMLFDEVQDAKILAIANAIKALTKAQYGARGGTARGIQVYFGTPKARGSDYWKMWNASSQQYYHLGCGACKKDFAFYTPNSTEWENIWIEDDLPEGHISHGYIVKCTNCGHEQDKRAAAERGKWVSYNKNGEEFIGYHINQLYMPDYTRKAIISQKPENHPINTERAWQNEVLGEFFAGDSSPITSDEIDKYCADHGRKFAQRILPDDNKKVYLGCDWGLKVDADQLSVGESENKKSQGQSYSCCVVLQDEGAGVLSIQYATRLKSNDWENKKNIVEQMFRQYSVTLAVGDIGFSQDLTENLQKTYGERFLASQACSRVNGRAKFKNDFFPSTIMFERDYYIAELYALMKAGKIRFPYGDYDPKLSWLINHITSMEIKTTIDRNGDVGMRYVKGSSPNDGFMALLNAYISYRYFITNGFKISDPNQINLNSNERRPILAIAGYVPGLNPMKRR